MKIAFIVVAISHEMIHEARLIPIGGQSPGDAFRGYMGFSAPMGEATVTDPDNGPDSGRSLFR